MGADDAGERLDRSVRDAEEDPRSRTEHHAVVLHPAAHAGADEQQAAEAEETRLEGDHRSARELRVGAVHRRQRQAQDHQAGGREKQAHPLTPSDFEAEQALGHHGDEHHARRQGDLDHRHGRERERGDVQSPARGSDGHAERKPLGGIEQPDRSQGMADLDLRHGVRPSELVEEPEVRHESADEGEEYS